MQQERLKKASEAKAKLSLSSSYEVNLAVPAKHELISKQGMKYHKIKFEQPISDYQRNIIVKLVEHVQSFMVTPEKLEQYWASYDLPQPYGVTSFEDLLNQISDITDLCIQDEEGGKVRYSIEHSKHYTASIHLNEWIRNLDTKYAKFASKPNHTNEELESMAGTMRDSLMLMNSSMFQFHFSQSNSDELTLEDAKMFYPDANFFPDAIEFHRLVSTLTSIDEYEHSADSHIRVDALHSSFIMMRGLCAFTMLCALINDAACGSLEFWKALVWIKESLQRTFRNAHLYRIIFPLSGVDTTKDIDQRGKKDHTTIMKLYLIDRLLNPVMIRIDLPHGRCKTLHLNVECKTDKTRYLDMNHFEIEADQTLDDLIPVLDSLRESMLHQMPHMLTISDTSEEDDDEMLTEMERFVWFDKMSLNVIKHEDYAIEIRKVAGYLGTDKNNLEETLKQSQNKFSL